LASAEVVGATCVGNELKLSGGPDGMTSYAWSGPSGFSSILQTPTVSVNATLSMSGSYTLNVISPDGCPGSDIVNVNVYTANVNDYAQVVCLLDLSGSMNMDYNDNYTSVDFKKKITIMKNALGGFIDLLNEFNACNAVIGLARFPNYPQTGCMGEPLTALNIINSDNKNTLLTSVSAFTAQGSTPLLDGIDKAKVMFYGNSQRKVIALLSDGRHNCPNTNITDAITTSYSNDLTARGILLYTIGFGRNENLVPNDMLSKMATGTSISTPGGIITGAHYNIAALSKSSYDPSSNIPWNAATALKAAYNDILVQGLGLNTTIEPLDIINHAEKKQFDIPVSGFEEKICFFTGWVTPSQNLLGVKLYTPSGIELPLNQAGVNVINRSTYTIITLSEIILKKPEMAGNWKIEIEGINVGTQPEYYQYSVINRTRKFDLRTWIGKSKFITGEKIKVYLELLSDGKPVTGLDKIILAGSRPAMSPGNWLTSKKIDVKMIEKAREKIQEEYRKELASIPLPAKMGDDARNKYISAQIQPGQDIINPVDIRIRALCDEYNVTLPGRLVIDKVTFSDNGRNGDQTAGDGIYTAVIVPDKEGFYHFNVSVIESVEGRKVQHEDQIGFFVNTRPRTSRFIKQLVLTDEKSEGEKIYNIILNLNDKKGNVPGPEVIWNIGVSVDKGKLSGGLIDNMDGTFTQKIAVPQDVKPGSIKMTINMGNESGTQKLSSGRLLLDLLLVIAAVMIFLFYRFAR
jgi:hypothetical protein